MWEIDKQVYIINVYVRALAHLVAFAYKWANHILREKAVPLDRALAQNACIIQRVPPRPIQREPCG